MPKNVMCKKCNNLINGWCEKKIDSPDPNMVRDCQYFWEKTNSDRIRAMNDEELANIMADTPICKERYIDCIKDGRDCESCLLEWLKQPAEE